MNTLIYIFFAFVLLYIGTTAVFLFLRKLDHDHIDKLTKENKEERAKNIKGEVARMALMRQCDEQRNINKKLQQKISDIKDKSFQETLDEL